MRVRNKIAFDVEEELRFHLEMIERENACRGMSSADAKAAARKRFGNLERVKNQCVKIRARNRLLRRVLKASSLLVGFAGLMVHILSPDPNIEQIGNTLITIAISGRLLLYVHSLSPSSLPKTKGASLSVVSDASRDQPGPS